MKFLEEYKVFSACITTDRFVHNIQYQSCCYRSDGAGYQAPRRKLEPLT